MGYRLLNHATTSIQGYLSLRICRSFHSSLSRAILYPSVDQTEFNKIINAQGRVAIVDFYAEWCGPCHQLSPIIQKLTAEPKKSGSDLPLDLVKINTDTDIGQTLAAEYQIRALPTVIAFRNGVIINRFQGALDEAFVERFLKYL